MDFLKNFGDSVGGWASAIAAALIGLAVYLPKISNGMKQDGINGNVLDRLAALEKKTDVQDKKIHKQAVRITKLVMLVIKLEALIVRSGVQIDKGLADEILALTSDEELGE
jgi:hypothetical protein